MPFKSLLQQKLLLIIILLGSTFLVVFLLYFFSKNLIQKELMPVIEDVVIFSNQEQVNIGLPVRLIIPNINVDALVEYVGLTPNGAVDVPKNLNVVGWFNLGPRPGEKGSSVIVGHYNWTKNTPAAFDDLHKLNINDEIFVEDEKGIIRTFIVREIQIYSKDAIVPEVFSSNNEKSHLNLITCTGIWNKKEQTLSERLIIFTDKE